VLAAAAEDVQEQDDVLGARLLVVPLGDLRFPDRRGDSPLSEQDTDCSIGDRPAARDRDEIAE
jgi:hypothetical protein